MSNDKTCRWNGAILEQQINGQWVTVPDVVAPPPPPPPPPPGNLTIEPVLVDGTPWTFRTAGPSQRTMRAVHPRLLVTPETLPGVKSKLQSAEYGDAATRRTPWFHIMRSNRTLDNAFKHLLGLGEQYGQAAIDDLVNGAVDSTNIGRRGELLAACLSYDWCHDLMSAVEVKRSVETIESMLGYDHRDAEPEGTIYGNDQWNAHTLGSVPHIWYVLAALAVHGDGVADDWAASVIDAAYTDHPAVMGPYGPETGLGVLDVLNSIALDTGGIQAGDNGTMWSNYSGFYAQGSLILLKAWETATGEEVVKDCNFFRFAPQHWWYEFNGEDTTDNAKATMEYITGLYPGAPAGLAQGLLLRNEYSNSALPLQMILGDRRHPATEPEDVPLPEAQYLRGADLFVSRSSWSDAASVVQVHARYIDSNRFEADSGILEYKYGSDVMLVGAEKVTKQHASPADHSGLWIVDANDMVGKYNQGLQGGVFWGRLGNMPGPHPRPTSAYQLVTDPLYRTGIPTRVEIGDRVRLIEIDSTKYWVEPGVNKVVRTVAHIVEPNREYLVIYDVVDAPGLDLGWTLRLPSGPDVMNSSSTHTALWFNGSAKGRAISYSTPGDGWEWFGGLNNEWVDPWWYDGHDVKIIGKHLPRAGYSSDPEKRQQLGLGNLSLTGIGNETLVVIEFTDFGGTFEGHNLSQLGGQVDGDTIRF